MFKILSKPVADRETRLYITARVSVCIYLRQLSLSVCILIIPKILIYWWRILTTSDLPVDVAHVVILACSPHIIRAHTISLGPHPLVTPIFMRNYMSRSERQSVRHGLEGPRLCRETFVHRTAEEAHESNLSIWSVFY